MSLLEQQAELANHHAARAKAIGHDKITNLAAVESKREYDCLQVINSALLSEGLTVNKRIRIGKDIFRVNSLGCPATRLGVELPEGEI